MNVAAEPARSGVSGFRPDIEGLRAIAALSVIIYHLDRLWLPGGFVGVDIFFVISGYLISGLLLNEYDTKGRIDFLAFYARRARRLLPIALIVIFVTLLLAPLFLSPIEQMQAARGGLASVIYLTNFDLIVRSLDYFSSAGAANPFLHYWSLAVEEQFYLFWPILTLLTLKFAHRHKMLPVLAFGILSFAACVVITRIRQPLAFYSLPTRGWEFAVGAAAMLLPRRLTPLAAQTVGWTGLVLVAGSLVLVKDAHYPDATAAIPVLGTAMVLFAGGVVGGRLRVLGTAPFQYVGKRSYSLYLWHWPIIVFASLAFNGLDAIGKIACGLAALALAAISLPLIENPIRHHRLLTSKPLWAMAGAAMAMLAGVGVTVSAFALGHHIGSDRDHIAISQAASLRSSLGKTNGCLIDPLDTKAQLCTFGSGSRSIMLFGDSHAAQWFTPVEAAAQASGRRVDTLLKSSCTVADVQIGSTRLKRRFDECARWRDTAIEEIIRRRPDVVVISEYSGSYISGGKGGGLEFNQPESVFIDGLQRSVTRISSAGIPVVVIADPPDPGYDVPIWLSRPHLLQSAASHPVEDINWAAYKKVTDDEVARLSGIPGVKYIDTRPYFCSGTPCNVRSGEVVIYRDNNHISETYIDKLKYKISDVVVSAIPQRR